MYTHHSERERWKKYSDECVHARVYELDILISRVFVTIKRNVAISFARHINIIYYNYLRRVHLSRELCTDFDAIIKLVRVLTLMFFFSHLHRWLYRIKSKWQSFRGRKPIPITNGRPDVYGNNNIIVNITFSVAFVLHCVRSRFVQHPVCSRAEPIRVCRTSDYGLYTLLYSTPPTTSSAETLQSGSD